MQCEICGNYIERGKKVKVEGSIIVTCDKCSSYGEIVTEVKPYESRRVQKESIAEVEKEKFEIEVLEEELVENFSKIIRERRENKKMNQEELARRINQSKSLIHRIESGKFIPDEELARKFEKILGIKLFHKSEKFEFKRKVRDEGELTLGDMVTIKKTKKKKPK